MIYDLIDMRAILEGCDVDSVDCFGGAYCLQEGANIQSFKIQNSENAKKAKSCIKEAKAAAKSGDKNKAVSKYEEAIKYLKLLKKDCEAIDDDHIVMVFLDSFIRAMIPELAAIAVIMIAPVTAPVAYVAGIFGSFICGMSKTLDWGAALEKGDVEANKQGRDGKADSAVWWKSSLTRGATMTKFDRMITACEQSIRQIKSKK